MATFKEDVDSAVAILESIPLNSTKIFKNRFDVYPIGSVLSGIYVAGLIDESHREEFRAFSVPCFEYDFYYSDFNDFFAPGNAIGSALWKLGPLPREFWMREEKEKELALIIGRKLRDMSWPKRLLYGDFLWEISYREAQEVVPFLKELQSMLND